MKFNFPSNRFSTKTKKNNKILQATSACCVSVVRNECRDHFSYQKMTLKSVLLEGKIFIG
jgi:hypothetical protein